MGGTDGWTFRRQVHGEVGCGKEERLGDKRQRRAHFGGTFREQRREQGG